MSNPPRQPAHQPYYTVESLEPMRSFGFLIKRCGTLMSLLAESRFESEPISFTQWIVLMKLRFHPHLSATQLSEEIGHDMGALTRLVDSLERSGFVRRVRSQQDRRAVEITLTAEGRRQVEGSIHILVDAMNELAEPFSNSEIDTLISLLQRMLGRLQEHVDKLPSPRPAARRAASNLVRPAARARKTAPRAPRGTDAGGGKA